MKKKKKRVFTCRKYKTFLAFESLVCHLCHRTDNIEQGFPNWGTCTPRGTFRFLKGYIIMWRMSLFKFNSVSGRNNRLKCLEFSNPVYCNYVKQDN